LLWYRCHYYTSSQSPENTLHPLILCVCTQRIYSKIINFKFIRTFIANVLPLQCICYQGHDIKL
jgi:hypothetical protein